MLTDEKPADDIDELSAGAIKEFAQELASRLSVSTDARAVAEIVSSIRWYANKAGAVIILRRGDKTRKPLATISPKRGKWTKLYPTWEPVLTELARRKREKSVSRMSHDELLAGELPE